MFSEALTMYLYRYRLAQGPQEKLTNVIVLEEVEQGILATYLVDRGIVIGFRIPPISAPSFDI